MQEEMRLKRGDAQQAGAFVRWKIQHLMNAGNESLAKASLARLRRGIGKPPGSLPELWAETMEGMPVSLAGITGQPSFGEWAIYLALTLFALHQQGNDLKTSPMSRDKQHLGKALRALVKNDEDEARIKRRFDQAVTSDTPEELAHHLRGLVQLLKSESIPLDYPALAQDLYRFQFSEQRDGVRLKWGRDFYRATFVLEAPQDQEMNNHIEKGEIEENEEE